MFIHIHEAKESFIKLHLYPYSLRSTSLLNGIQEKDGQIMVYMDEISQRLEGYE